MLTHAPLRLAQYGHLPLHFAGMASEGVVRLLLEAYPEAAKVQDEVRSTRAVGVCVCVCARACACDCDCVCLFGSVVGEARISVCSPTRRPTVRRLVACRSITPAGPRRAW